MTPQSLTGCEIKSLSIMNEASSVLKYDSSYKLAVEVQSIPLSAFCFI